jgi:hypothetical protein
MKRCLFPKPCSNLVVDHSDYLKLLRELRALPKVKKVFVRSGFRFDYLMADKNREFLRELCRYHVSGQLRVAPEHISDNVLKEMGKPPVSVYNAFVDEFNKINEQLGLHQFVVPYLMSSHPGSTMKDAIALAEYIRKMGYMPEQVQDFYPTPGTVSTTMYYTGLDPLTMKPVYVERDPHRKAMQRALIQFRDPKNYELVKEALLEEHREDLIGFEKTCLIPPRKIVRKAGHVVHSHMAHAAHEDSAGSGKSGSLGGHFRMAHTEHESKSRMTRAAHENNSHMTNAAHGNNSHMAHSEHGNSSGRRNTRGKHGRLERNNGR